MSSLCGGTLPALPPGLPAGSASPPLAQGRTVHGRGLDACGRVPPTWRALAMALACRDCACRATASSGLQAADRHAGLLAIILMQAAAAMSGAAVLQRLRRGVQPLAGRQDMHAGTSGQGGRGFNLVGSQRAGSLADVSHNLAGQRLSPIQAPELSCRTLQPPDSPSKCCTV